MTEVEQEFPLMAVVIVLALVFVVTLIVTAIVCRVCRRHKLSETQSDSSSEAPPGSTVHQKLLKSQPSSMMITVNKLDDILYEKPITDMTSTPLNAAPGFLVPECASDNLSSVAGIYQSSLGTRQPTYLSRDKSVKSLGR